MSLYKNKEDVITTVVIKREEGKIGLEFSADCGTFGADEMLDGYTLTPERLLEVLQEYDNYLDNEL